MLLAIGALPIADRSGDKCHVLFKNISLQYRVVYRMKTKDEIAKVWSQFLADHGTVKHADCTITCRTEFLITDNDMYKKKADSDKVIRGYYNIEVSELLNDSSTDYIVRT